MEEYSQKVMDHFMNPRNVGVMENPDAVGEVGNPRCGDIMRMYLKIKNDIITDIKFQTFGCGAAVATSSMVTELGKKFGRSSQGYKPRSSTGTRWTSIC